MANILNVSDIVNSIKTIEKDCEMVDGFGVKMSDPDYKKFYERVKGLMALVEENLSNKKGGGVMG
jgi:predicted adenine nucleotide alpha hydrolase (AANH) superfamily ATPase